MASSNMMVVALVLSSLAGFVILIAILEHWFLLIIVVILCFYFALSHFYSASSTEMKQLGSIQWLPPFGSVLLIISCRCNYSIIPVLSFCRITVWPTYN